jgi:hypothetical protein
MNLGTWNVTSLNKPAAQRVLITSHIKESPATLNAQQQKRRKNGAREDAVTLLGLRKLRPEIDTLEVTQ